MAGSLAIAWRRPSHSAVWGAILSLALSARFAWSQDSHVESVRPPEADAALSFPGNAREAMIRFLDDTLDQYQIGQKPLENVLVQGKLSREATRNVLGKSQDIPEPRWQPFKYAVKNGIKRFERGYTQWTSEGGQDMTIYRHLDGDAICKLDGKSLAMYPLDDVDRRWEALTYEIAMFQMPYDAGDRQWCSLTAFLEKTKDRLNSHWENFDNEAYVLKCVRQNGVIHISYEIGPDAHPDFQGDFSGVWIDSRFGYSPVRVHHSYGKADGPVLNSCDATVQYQEISPGVFYPKTATSLTVLGGTNPLKNGSAGTVRNDLMVETVQFGDFECDEDLLTVKGLPIPVGTNIEDYRSTPAKTYTFGRAPIEDSVLNQQLRPARPWLTARLLLSVAVIALLIIACLGVKRPAVK